MTDRIAAESAALPKIPRQVLDQNVADGPMTAQQVNVTMMALKKAIIERALGGELSSPASTRRPATEPGGEGVLPATGPETLPAGAREVDGNDCGLADLRAAMG